VIPTGLAATYSAEALDFVRQFDSATHDPAATYREYQAWRARATALFLEANVLAAAPPGHGRTMLQIIMEQAQNAPPIFSGSRVVHLWSQPTADELDRWVGGIQTVVRLALDRMDVEFDVSHAEVSFTALDLLRWRVAFTHAREGDRDALDLLQRHARAMFDIWKLPPGQGVKELEECAAVLLRDVVSNDIGSNASNWVKVLRPGFSSEVGRLEVLPHLLPVYLSAMDSTGQVERDLGKLAHILEVHSGPLDEDGEVVAWLMEVHVDGPVGEEELATRFVEGDNSGVTLLPTDFTRECGGLWVGEFGRRFRQCARPKRASGSQKSAPRMGTLARVAHECRRARDALSAPDRARPAGGDLTLLGIPRSRFARPALGHSLSPLLVQLVNTTENKQVHLRQVNEARAATRRTRANPYSVGDLNPHQNLRLGVGVSGGLDQPGIEVPAGRMVRVLDCTADGVDTAAVTRTCRVARWSPSNLFLSLQSSDLVVLDSVWGLDAQASLTSDVLKAHFGVVALGCAVLGKADWHGRSPYKSPKALRFLCLAKETPMDISLTAAFVGSHPRLAEVIKKAAAIQGSRWQVVAEHAAAAAGPLSTLEASAGSAPKAKAKAKAQAKAKANHLHVTLDSLQSVRGFLQQHRRFARVRDVSISW
jgi:hypothetical protein